ncbi:MAG: MFS transporter [Acidobacteria bacterium]|nr:MFS transporter [Acidobacteriota bacterium]MCB9397399.1 MFS transporter [Acidobacteriota bacterium]
MKRYLPILATDFLFWFSTAGMYPLLARLTHAILDPVATNQMIANMILAFTVCSLTGRFLVGRSQKAPKKSLLLGTSLGTLGFLVYFLPNPQWWLLGRAIQGFALGHYAISIITLTSMVLPSGRHFKGFALIGMADFLGFSSGPVVSGLLLHQIGGTGTLLVFGFCMALTNWTGSKIRTEKTPQDDETIQFVLKPPTFRKLAFIPLAVGIFFGLLFHIFYSNYLPIMIDETQWPVETVFFAGYVLGGFGFRIKISDWFEALPGPVAYGVAIVVLASLTVGIAFWPLESPYLDSIVFASGFGYGLALEAIYIFTLAWVSQHTSLDQRSRVYAMVFSGVDISSLVAGTCFGVLANSWGPFGLQKAMLFLLPVFLVMPILVHFNFRPGSKSSDLD